ncbi:Succinyl-CoA:coenzyme A transferase [uncultured Alphaproteobacteria bacterium]|uniref:Succinyl-CoA:coenzyme A transferase n=1 Tax=uncultured Alphaproteobacteria bacterium TaxID=91750 RepID=A0A212JII8_9PROT|nr:Succinyl-CoA:coenzyme A transferase [uncultured Alphaproteobacteria bacterium]
MSDRIRMKSLLSKVCSAEEAAAMITDGMVVGISGFTKFGDARAVPLALVKRVEAGEKLAVTLMTGASIGSNLDEDLGDHGVIARRLPYMGSGKLREHINAGRTMYLDQHLSHTGEYIRGGGLPKPDIAVLDTTYITEEGGLVCTSSVGNNALWALNADKIIVEINETHPFEMYGLHDIYTVGNRPGRGPIPIINPGDKVGTPFIPIDPKKIVAIVVHQMPDTPVSLSADADAYTIAGHLMDFFKHEVKKGVLTNTLRPLQSGVGAVANAVFAGFQDSPFHDLTMYTEVAQDAVFDLIDSGKMTAVSTTAISVTKDYMRIFDDVNKLHGKLVLRPQEISNHPEVIRRLGLISINTALEADIYGNVNSTHVAGTKMMNGIGGSGDFARNAGYTCFVTTSCAKKGKLSSIVPMVSHVDHTEHDVNVICTEQGLADLRGLAPRERSRLIIENCVHPNFKDMMRDYVKEAEALGGHTPHVIGKALSWHQRFLETGSMLEADAALA